MEINEQPRSELLKRMERDQAMRNEMMAKYKPGQVFSQDDFQRALAVDQDNTAWLKQVIAVHGWPGHSLVGVDGAHAAWLLAQHADHDREFQKGCLQLLEEAVNAGEASGKDLAYLTDRVLVAEHNPQRYGTQFTIINGELVPAPIEEPETVNERRARVGLMPLAEYVEMTKKHLDG